MSAKHGFTSPHMGGFPVASMSKRSGYEYANIEARSVVSRMAVKPDDTRKALIDTLVGDLKTGGVWSKLDALYVMAAHDAQAAQRNWKQNAYNLTVVTGPTFTADEGYTGNGSTGRLETGFIPSTAGGNYVQNSACYGVFSLTDAAAAGTSNFEMGTDVNAVRADLRVRTSGDALAMTINDATLGSLAATGAAFGLTLIRRSAAGARNAWRNGSQVFSDTQASTGVPAEAFAILANGNGGGASAAQLAAAVIGANLLDAEATALYDALTVYLTAVGAVV